MEKYSFTSDSYVAIYLAEQLFALNIGPIEFLRLEFGQHCLDEKFINEVVRERLNDCSVAKLRSAQFTFEKLWFCYILDGCLVMYRAVPRIAAKN